MTLTFGFFNSLNLDRVYDANQMGRMFDGVILDGVFGSIGDCFVVTEYGNMDLHVGTGRAWFNHTWSNNDSVITVTIAESHPILPRYDTIVLEINADPDVRANTIKVIPGTPASDPELPTLINTETVHQYGLANVLIEADVQVLNQGDIENLVGGLSCPFVTGPLSMISVEDLINQWETQFTVWFEALQNELDENQAANLQNQIYNHDHSEELLTPVVGIATNAVTSPTIASLAISTSKIADNAVDDTKVGDRVPQIYRRQGSSPTDWSEGGSSTQIPGAVRIQVGVMHWSQGGGGANSGTIVITFPVAFSNIPLVYAQFVGAITNAVIWTVDLLSSSVFTFRWKTIDTVNINMLDFNWWAVGPE